MQRLKYYLLTLLIKISKIERLQQLFHKKIPLWVKGHLIEQPSMEQVRRYYKQLYKRLGLFNYRITTKNGFVIWQNRDWKRTAVHTIIIENVDIPNSSVYVDAWMTKYNWIVNFKAAGGFNGTRAIFNKDPIDGVIRLGLVCSDKHFGRPTYNKWVGQMLFLFDLLYLMHKPTIKFVDCDKEAISNEFFEPIQEFWDKYNRVYFGKENVGLIKKFINWMSINDSFRIFLWNNEIYL